MTVSDKLRNFCTRARVVDRLDADPAAQSG
jgi:hypothetical protein